MEQQNYIITIGRQIGAGGLQVSQGLAQKLDIQAYDDNLLDVVAEEMGMDLKLFEKNDEKRSGGGGGFFNGFFGVRAATGTYNSGLSNTIATSERIFDIQSAVMQKLASKSPIIVVGRCADYIFRDYPRCLSLFLTADLEERIGRVSARRGISREEAIKFIEQGEKQRKSYYNYYTFKQWGDSASYDLCINTTKLGIDGTVNQIINIINSLEWTKK